MKVRNKFTEEELKLIKEAVRKAELEISGEIVPFFRTKCSEYEEVFPKSFMAFILLYVILAFVLDRVIYSAHWLDPYLLLSAAGLLAMISAFIAFFVDPVKRWFAGRRRMTEAVELNAERAFLKEEVFKTKDRTGVLIMISFFEKTVVIKADKGISSVVDKEEWQEIVDEIIKYIKQDKVKDGIITAIEKTTALIKKNGFLIKEDDTNELKNDLRLGK